MSGVIKKSLSWLVVGSCVAIVAVIVQRQMPQVTKMRRVKFMRHLCMEIRTSSDPSAALDPSRGKTLTQFPSGIVEDFLSDRQEGKVRLIGEFEDPNSNWQVLWQCEGYVVACSRDEGLRITVSGIGP